MRHATTTTGPGPSKLARTLTWVGALGLLLGAGPLIACIILIPNSNPIGPGLLFFFSFWPSVGCLAAGLGMRLRERAKRRERLFGE